MIDRLGALLMEGPAMSTSHETPSRASYPLPTSRREEADPPVIQPVALRPAAWVQDAAPPPERSQLRRYAARLAADPRLTRVGARARSVLTGRGWPAPAALVAGAGLFAVGWLGGSAAAYDAPPGPAVPAFSQDADRVGELGHHSGHR